MSGSWIRLPDLAQLEDALRAWNEDAITGTLDEMRDALENDPEMSPEAVAYALHLAERKIRAHCELQVQITLKRRMH